MPTPRFPATAILLDAKRCPLDKFDALYAKITQERRIVDGYFRHDHPEDTRFLFVVNGSPYGSGRVVDETCTFHEVHEFFAAYAEHPESPLSFFVADKRLLLGLMVLFRREPALTFKTQVVDVVEMLETIADRKADQILAMRSNGDWAISLMAKGRLAATFLPLAASTGQATDPAERLAAYIGSRAEGVALDVYDESRVEPAGDVILVTPETRNRLAEVFLQVAAKVREEEATAPLTLDVPQAEPASASVEPSVPVTPVDEMPIDAAPPEPLVAEAAPLELEGPITAPDDRLDALATPAPGDHGDALPVADLDLLAPLTLDVPQAEPASASVEPSVPVTPVDEMSIDAAPPEPLVAEAAPLELEGPITAPDDRLDAQATPRTAPASGAPEVILFLGDKPIGTFSLAAGEITIGRTPTNTIVIDNAGVSRRHAVIRFKGDKAVVEDLGSANGTFVRGQKVQEHVLQDGDEIAIVKHRLLFRIPKAGESAPPKPEPAPDTGQRTMYIDAAMVAQAVGTRLGSRPEVVASALRPRLILPDLKKFALEVDEVSMGTAPGCQIQLSGMFVGKVHAKIVRTKEGQFRIQHVAGLAGTRVNGEKISEHLLKHGDEIEIGKQRLLFRLER